MLRHFYFRLVSVWLGDCHCEYESITHFFFGKDVCALLPSARHMIIFCSLCPGLVGWFCPCGRPGWVGFAGAWRSLPGGSLGRVVGCLGWLGPSVRLDGSAAVVLGLVPQARTN